MRFQRFVGLFNETQHAVQHLNSKLNFSSEPIRTNESNVATSLRFPMFAHADEPLWQCFLVLTNSLMMKLCKMSQANETTGKVHLISGLHKQGNCGAPCVVII